MKNTSKNKVRNQELQNLAEVSKGGYMEGGEIISRMYELKEQAENEMGWTVSLAYEHFYWVYSVEDEIIGFVKKIPMKGDLGLLQFIYVQPEHRGNGYGTDMVKQFSQRFESVWVEIRDDEIESFYRQLEPTFRKARVHKKWQDHPELDYSDSLAIPNGPFVEKTDKLL